MELIIIMGGGVIQSVLSPNPEALKAVSITIIDYDVEDVSPDCIDKEVQQSSGEWVEAFVWKPVPEQLELNPLNIRDKEV